MAPLTAEQKDAILIDARAQRSKAKADAQAVIKAKKVAALGISAKAAAGESGVKPKAEGGVKSKPEGGAKPKAAASSSPKKASKPGLKGARAKLAGEHASPTADAAPAADQPAAAAAKPALKPEEREAQREERARERERVRAELEQAILKEEQSIRASETAARKAEAAKRASEAKLLEAAFDGEVELIATQVAEWQAACASRLIGAKLAFADPSGHTALSEAAVAGHTHICRLLLEAGASANARNVQGRTPLWRAAFQGRADTVRLLLEYGADPRIPSADGETPQMVASVAELKAELGAWDLQRTDELLAQAASAAQWTPPPPDARDERVPSGQPGHSAQIIIQRFPDVLEEVTLNGDRYLLVVDLSGKALTYLQYRDSNLLNFCRPADVIPETVRRALVGALRYGKPLVLDLTLMSDISLEMLDAFFEPVLPGGGLRDAIVERRILQPEVYERLLTQEELGAQSDLRLSQWQESTTAYFCLCVITKNPLVSQEIAELFFVLKCA